jgi:DNA-binding CsgD family transcriptional regulator/tetratricopeptide (TPR) repeat protein
VALVGRTKECAQIDELLASVNDGFSGVLVVRGEAGVGKTALIDYAVQRAEGFSVVRLTGVEPERELSFAALHRMLTPLLDQVGELPTPQREALSSALGLVAGPPATPFLVGLAVISLTAAMSDADQCLMCVVDDAQWVDSESLEALAFWGRRLQADRVALIFGERTGTLATDPLQGLPELEVSGLEREAARTLLISAAGFQPDRDVADRVLEETEGNPLAIIELARNLASHMLVGRAASPHPLPLTRRLEDRFVAQVLALPADTQMFLLLVAADASSNATMVWNAASRIGVSRQAAEAAEVAGLISLGYPVRYRHPLIRSAVYGAASPADRRAAHEALASASDPTDIERWAWHRAGAVLGPDEEVAKILESCASQALANGATSAAVALLSRAAELSPEMVRAAERRITAAEAAVERGSLVQTHILVEHATPALRNPSWKARAERVSGLADFREGNLVLAASRLRVAATGLLPTDPLLGQRTLLEAVDIAIYDGASAQSEFMRSVAATNAHLPGAPPSVMGLLLHGFSTHAQFGYGTAAPEYAKAIAFCRDAHPQALAPWTNLIAAATANIWDDASHDLILGRIAEWSRSQGSLFPLWLALFYLATSAERRGDFKGQAALLDQAADVLSITGPFSVPRIGVELDALRGQENSVSDDAMDASETLDQASIYAMHDRLLRAQLGIASYDEALGHARVLFDADPMMFGPHLLSDMIEAAVRVRDRDAAENALARLTERATASGTQWALGMLARSQALMATDAGAGKYYSEALEQLRSTTMSFERARTHLLYGEWLRRMKRNIDAREHLRQAHEMFCAMEAQGFIERARVELLATGGRARKRTVDTSNDLTPQETQIAKLVGRGAPNREIAAQLFISQSTVEYHLHKVFRKLGVTSRTQLARLVLEMDQAS